MRGPRTAKKEERKGGRGPLTALMKEERSHLTLPSHIKCYDVYNPVDLTPSLTFYLYSLENCHHNR
jgi:hypothetical protein